ncbi:molybdopterin-dependent oxidoreductase [Candidatus Woesearchaeota archaeon]|nr:molybdopterin-dependent oxidoreductase [Candidatus Woesearchaeota archaeon]
MVINERWVKAKETIADTLRGTHHQQESDKRLPPGQHWTPGFPVLDLGIQPDMNMSTWKLKISGLAKEQELSLADLKKLGPQKVVQDLHCVTSWSKKDVQWTGIPIKKILNKVKPDPSWKFLIQYGADNYTTNVPREDVERDDVFLVYELDGKPIPKEHGYVRLLIPQLYAWKTSKFLIGLEFSKTDKPGFWEVRGYNNHGNAFKEERYS